MTSVFTVTNTYSVAIESDKNVTLLSLPLVTLTREMMTNALISEPKDKLEIKEDGLPAFYVSKQVTTAKWQKTQSLSSHFYIFMCICSAYKQLPVLCLSELAKLIIQALLVEKITSLNK